LKLHKQEAKGKVQDLKEQVEDKTNNGEDSRQTRMDNQAVF
jgi:polyhydroxyalkanoate synthesis regulator phasin